VTYRILPIWILNLLYSIDFHILSGLQGHFSCWRPTDCRAMITRSHSIKAQKFHADKACKRKFFNLCLLEVQIPRTRPRRLPCWCPLLGCLPHTNDATRGTWDQLDLERPGLQHQMHKLDSEATSYHNNDIPCKHRTDRLFLIKTKSRANDVIFLFFTLSFSFCTVRSMDKMKHWDKNVTFKFEMQKNVFATGTFPQTHRQSLRTPQNL